MKTPLATSLGIDLKKVSLITSDSRKVENNCIFVALPTANVDRKGIDGHEFIETSFRNGASWALAEKIPSRLSKKMVEKIKLVQCTRTAISTLASEFYGLPSYKMKIIGVTGTSGKTTTTYLLESIFLTSGRKVGVVGTVNYRFDGKVIDASHTTPDPVSLNKLLREMKDAGVDLVIMEVSSHAIKQKRVLGVAFDCVGFANLSAEHLDYHDTMEEYFSVKSELFTAGLKSAELANKKPIAVINTDDPYGKKLWQSLSIPKVEFSESSLVNLVSNLNGVSTEIDNQKYQSNLIGNFNAMNILLSVKISEALGLDPHTISKGVAALECVPGRLESVTNSKNIFCFVDYAHKPDAVKKVLENIRPLAKKKLITVIGCGGDRDRSKRPVMGEAAAKFSDRVIITSDNPRTEDPQKIIDEIVSGLKNYSNCEVEQDRATAIKKAIDLAEPEDVVFIAGKGHETYQILPDPGSPKGTRLIDFDDKVHARDALESKKTK